MGSGGVNKAAAVYSTSVNFDTKGPLEGPRATVTSPLLFPLAFSYLSSFLIPLLLPPPPPLPLPSHFSLRLFSKRKSN